jgi:hypothetical protein
MNSVVGDVRSRSAPWKRRLTLRDSLILIAAVAVDLALLRASNQVWLLPLIPLVGLLVIMVYFVWRHVPRAWDRACYVAALILYLLFLAVLVVSYNPVLIGPFAKFWGLE